MIFSLEPERGGPVQLPCHGQARPLAFGEGTDATNGLATRWRSHCPRFARYTIQYPRMTCRYPCTELDCNIEVFGDADFAVSPRANPQLEESRCRVVSS